jgi:hypothetical protein
VVYKYISAVFTSDKAKAFAVVKPLNSSLCHFFYLLLYNLNLRRPQEKGHRVKSPSGLVYSQKLLKFY